MPAYSKTLPQRTCRQCGKKATVEVFNARNGSCGDYCTRHGAQAVADLDRLDAALPPNSTTKTIPGTMGFDVT